MNEWDRIAMVERHAAAGIVRCKGADQDPVDKLVIDRKGVCTGCGKAFVVTRYDQTVRTHYVKKGA